MFRGFAVLLMLSSIVPMRAADPPGVVHLSSEKLKAFEKSLAAKIDSNKVASEKLADFGNHSMMIVHRQGDGEAELHESQADVFVIQSGEAKLVLGGTVQEGRNTAPGEVRGRGISGGERKKLSVGDVVHIPAKVPHQVMVAPGKQVTYFVVKIDSK